jgi:hypothetical protein
MPEANEMVVRIMAVVAQAERKMISARTKASLQAAKARGVALGGLRHRPDGSIVKLDLAAIAAGRAARTVKVRIEQPQIVERVALMGVETGGDQHRVRTKMTDRGICESLSRRGIARRRPRRAMARSRYCPTPHSDSVNGRDNRRQGTALGQKKCRRVAATE